MKILIIYIILLLLSLEYSFADSGYPFSYSEMQVLEGGELLLIKPNQSQEAKSFFIKQNWTGELETLYYWDGIKRENTKGVSWDNSVILGSFAFDEKIILCWWENERIFISEIDENASLGNVAEILGNWDIFAEINVKFLNIIDSQSVLLLINNNLYLCTFQSVHAPTIKFVAENVVTATALDNKDYILVYGKASEGSLVLYYLTSDAREVFAARVNLSEESRLLSCKDFLLVISSFSFGKSSLMQLLDYKNGILSEQWLETIGSRITLSKNTKKLYSLKYKENNYYLNIKQIDNEGKISVYKENLLNEVLIEPFGIWIIDDVVYAVFRNGICTYNESGEQLSFSLYPFGEYFSQISKLQVVDEFLIISSASNSIVFSKSKNHLWMLNRFLKNTGKILLPMLLGIALIIFIQLWRHQKRLLNVILSLPSLGVVYIFDKYGRLKRANEMGKKWLGITDSVPLGKLLQYYFNSEEALPFKELIDKSLVLRDTTTQKLIINRGLDTREWYCSVLPIRNITGFFRGLVVTGVDITEELEKKRLSNWAQLAHDMQTNLSTIRLNAEHLEVNGNNDNESRRTKILHQVGILIQRIRDIVTVGRSNKVEKQTVDSKDMCNEIIAEFDKAMFPNVEFVVQADNFKVSCDKQKILRALRNAIENGIRSLPNRSGTIFLSCNNDSRFAYFKVKDSGIGMDEKTKAKMLTPYFTTSQKQGGTGIGTMIMQYVIELHGGELIVNSEKGKGTEIIFCIPNYTKSQSNKTNKSKLFSKRGNS